MNKILLLYFFSITIASFCAMKQETHGITTEIFIIQHNDIGTPAYLTLQPNGNCELIEKFDLPMLPPARLYTPPNSTYHYIESAGAPGEDRIEFDPKTITHTHVSAPLTEDQISIISKKVNNKDSTIIAKVTTKSLNSKTQRYFDIKQITFDYPTMFSKFTTIVGIVGIVSITIACILIVIAKGYLFSQ